jgi:hypothetical protein
MNELQLCSANKTNQRVVYVLSIRHYNSPKTYKDFLTKTIFTNLDSAIKKALDIHFDDEQIFDTLVAFSNIVFDSSNTEDKELQQVIIKIFHKTINRAYDFTYQHISKKLFLKVKHLIPNPEKYNQQDLYDHFIEFYVGKWKNLFLNYTVTTDNIQTKIQKMVDYRNQFYQFKHDIELDKNKSCDLTNKITKSYLKKRYPKISFLTTNSEEFEFEVNSFVNEVFGFKLNQTFIIETFILDED